MLLKELEYIIAIAEEGSISRAADRLFMAQSSLSEFLKQYEAELGSRLEFAPQIPGGFWWNRPDL